METIRVHLGARARLAALAALAAMASLVLLAITSQGSTASAAGATASRSSTVTIDHFEFMPRTIDIAKGGTVVFANESKVKHTATERGVFNTGKIKPGQAAAVRFTAKGTYSYHCTIHPKMHGKIVVG